MSRFTVSIRDAAKVAALLTPPNAERQATLVRRISRARRKGHQEAYFKTDGDGNLVAIWTFNRDRFDQALDGLRRSLKDQGAFVFRDDARFSQLEWNRELPSVISTPHQTVRDFLPETVPEDGEGGPGRGEFDHADGAFREGGRREGPGPGDEGRPDRPDRDGQDQLGAEGRRQEARDREQQERNREQQERDAEARRRENERRREEEARREREGRP